MDNTPGIRDHMAVKTAAGVMRVSAVVVAIVTVLLALGSLVGGAALRSTVPQLGNAGLIAAILILLGGGIQAVLIWAFADIMIIVADLDDGQRWTRYSLGQVLSAVGRSPQS